MHLAARADSGALVQALRHAVADLEARNGEGRTPLLLAAERGCTEAHGGTVIVVVFMISFPGRRAAEEATTYSSVARNVLSVASASEVTESAPILLKTYPSEHTGSRFHLPAGRIRLILASLRSCSGERSAQLRSNFGVSVQCYRRESVERPWGIVSPLLPPFRENHDHRLCILGM